MGLSDFTATADLGVSVAGVPLDPQDLFGKLPTIDQIAARVRRQSIGAILADICRDLGITRDHPLWDELHDAIEYGGSFVRLVRTGSTGSSCSPTSWRASNQNPPLHPNPTAQARRSPPNPRVMAR